MGERSEENFGMKKFNTKFEEKSTPFGVANQKEILTVHLQQSLI